MDFMDEVSKYAEKAAQISKDALTKAGEAVTRFGDESVIKIEKRQLMSQVNQEVNELGLAVLKAFIDDEQETVSKTDENVSSHIEKIISLRADIAKKDELLNSQKK